MNAPAKLPFRAGLNALNAAWLGTVVRRGQKRRQRVGGSAPHPVPSRSARPGRCPDPDTRRRMNPWSLVFDLAREYFPQ